MTRRKAKTTLTNIDPTFLQPKPLAVSQHATSNGARVTTPIHPTHKTPPPVVPDLDLSNFNREWFEAEVNEEESDEEDSPLLVRALTHRQV